MGTSCKSQLTSLGHCFLIYKMEEMMEDLRWSVSQVFRWGWGRSIPSTFCSSYTQSIALSQVLFSSPYSCYLLQSGMFSKDPFNILLLTLQSPNHMSPAASSTLFSTSLFLLLRSGWSFRHHHIQQVFLDTLLGPIQAKCLCYSSSHTVG